MTERRLTPREWRRLVRRFELAHELGDIHMLDDDGTIRTTWRGTRGWRRAWIKIRIWAVNCREWWAT